MIKNSAILNYEYQNYGNIPEKIQTEVKNGRLIKIKRGFYVTSDTTNPFTIANSIVSPSYISFETALAYYSLIPERVYLIKSATFKKNKTKSFKTPIGSFYYQDIYEKAYPYGIDTISMDGVNVSIASPEKAILDMLSVISPRDSVKEVKDLLFDDLRINEILFDELDKNKMIELSKFYVSKTIKYLVSYLEDNNDK